MNRFLLPVFAWFFFSLPAAAQQALPVPGLLTGTVFYLNVVDSTTQFWPGVNTVTYGVNGPLLGPTLVLQKGDSVTLHVTNQLTGAGNSTTMHWHGLHVPAMDDGGPHRVINQGATWSPRFKVMNDAGTFWYHPHGLGKTDRHVSKGVAGFILVKDAAEAALNLPRTYGLDDFPVVLQTKEFDVLHQIAMATFMDTLVLANGVSRAYLNVPAQTIRLRLLNGASQRTFLLGFQNNASFALIGNDGGLLDTPQVRNRLMLSNGERAEILLDLSGQQGDTLRLMCFGSEMPKGVYGADTVGDQGPNQIPAYYSNPLNGADFMMLELRVGPTSPNPVTGIPASLIPQQALQPSPGTVYRSFVIDTMGGMGITPNFAAGPFAFNQELFDMDSINEVVMLNSREVWTIYNRSMIAHPFHMHDVQFNILDINGQAPPAYEKGKKDVVLVMPGDTVRLITEFTDFADDSIPYMYHCHILHHEDDGMMGSFLVKNNWPAGLPAASAGSPFTVFPNPGDGQWYVCGGEAERPVQVRLNALTGKRLMEIAAVKGVTAPLLIGSPTLPPGMYVLEITQNGKRWIHRVLRD